MTSTPDWNEGQLEEACRILEDNKLWGCGLLINEDGEPTKPDCLHVCLKKLVKLHRYLPRDKFLSLFPEQCPGCLMLSILGASDNLSEPELAAAVCKDMLNDSNGDVLALPRLCALRADAREAWQNKDVPFPGNGRCDWVGRPTQTLLKRYGMLIASPSFASAMSVDASACVNILRDLGFFESTDDPADLAARLEEKTDIVLESDWNSYGLSY